MADHNFNKNDIIQHWIAMADNDYQTMIDLEKMKHYPWALFLGHLVIEKLLKACYVKHNNEHPVFSHNLLKLAIKSGIELNDEVQLQLDTITTFNMNARYDDVKFAFYKKCTPEYTAFWVNNIKNLRTWIKEVLTK